MWYFANMSEDEIEERLVHIVGMFNGIHEDKIELICQTIAILEAEKECVDGLSTPGERLFFREIARGFIDDCVPFLHSEGFNSNKMGKLLGVPQQRLQTAYRKVVWNIQSAPPVEHIWHLDKNGRIAPAGMAPREKLETKEEKPPEIPEGVCQVNVSPEVFDMLMKKMIDTPHPASSLN